MGGGGGCKKEAGGNVEKTGRKKTEEKGFSHSRNGIIRLQYTDACSEFHQTFKMELFAKNLNG